MKDQPSKLRSQHSLKSELPYSLPISIFSAHLFVAYQQEENLIQIFFKPGYFIAFFVSICIAFLLILSVKYTTRILDRKQAWEADKLQRLWLQFFYGFVITILIELGMSSAYFEANGYSISETVWEESYLLPIAMYILMINWYYNPTALDVPAKEPAAEPVVELPQATTNDDTATILKDTIEKDIVFISTSDRKVYALNRKGHYVLWPYTLTRTIAALPAENFIMANRSCILHREIIDRLKPDADNHTLTLILKTPFKDPIDIPYDSIRKFEKWWYKKSA